MNPELNSRDHEPWCKAPPLARTYTLPLGFWVSLFVLVLGPSKFLAYTSSLTITALLLIIANHNGRVILQLLGAAICLSFAHLTSLMFAAETHSINVGLSLILFLWIPVVWVIFRTKNTLAVFTPRVHTLLKVTISLQLVVGYTQLLAAFFVRQSIDLDLGDYVEGTLSPNLASDRSFSNPMFATMMILLCLMLWSHPKLNRMDKFLLAASIVLVLSASVLHVTFLGMVALVAAGLIVYTSSRKFLSVVILGFIGITFVVAFMSTAMPTNFRLATDFVTLDEYDNYKLRGYKAAFQSEALPLGHGLGTFGGRSYKIATGEFQGVRSTLFGPQNSTMVERVYLMQLWLEALKRNKRGASATPYTSATVLIGELGLLGLVFIIAVPLVVLANLAKEVTRTKRKANHRATFGAAAIFFLVYLLGCFELYWDLPQIMLLAGFASRYCWEQRLLQTSLESI